MSGIKISALPSLPSALLSDIFPVVQGGVTYQESMSQLVTLMSSSLPATFVPLAGGTMTGPLILNQDPIIPLGAATKEYVDTVAVGFTVILSCAAASTTNLNATYNNGTSGVGATLTNAGTQAAFIIDGYTANLNDRILVKNQTSSFANGIYSVTNIGSGTTNWVLTRTTDYNHAPAQIHPGTLVTINSGTTNATTSWLETATVNTIGTDPILFSQFTFSPASYLLRSNNLSDLGSVPTALVNLGLGAPVGTGNVVLQTSPTLITPNLGVATATSLQFSPSTGGIKGTITNDNASAGMVGEFISSIVALASAVPLSSSVTASITSVSLTPGDWSVSGEIGFNGPNNTQITLVGGGVSLSSTGSTIPSINGSFAQIAYPYNTYVLIGANSVPYLALSPCRISISTTTTVYLITYAYFTVNTFSAYGKITATRIR